MYVVSTEASMHVSIDIEALDTLSERVPSAARLDDHRNADEMFVGMFPAMAPLPIANSASAGGVS